MRRLAARARPRHAELAVVLALGVVLRVALLLGYTPAFLSYPDSGGYVSAARGPLFAPEPIRPAGYPALLAALHAVVPDIAAVVVVQAVAGLATAVVLHAALRRLGAPRWCALVPAAVVALCLDTIYFEHTLLSETPFQLALALALLALACAAAAGRRARAWLAAAGVALAAATMLRSLGLMTALATIAVVAAAWPGGRRARMGAATVIAAGFAVPLAGYVAVQASQTHRVELTTGTGWALYARVAPFADCREFAPPPGTAGLCEARDARTRPGPDFYAWYPASPAQQHFGHPPQHDDRLGAFARAVIRAQPRAYASAVATDLWRFVVPDAGRDRPARGAGPSELAVDGRVPAQERLNRAAAAPLYATGPAHVRAAAHTLADVQRVVRVHGPLLLAALLLAVLGCLAAPGRRERLALALLVVPGLTSLVLSTALTVYNWRYAVPYLPFLTAGGALGAHVLAGRVRTRIGARTPV